MSNKKWAFTSVLALIFILGSNRAFTADSTDDTDDTDDTEQHTHCRCNFQPPPVVTKEDMNTLDNKINYSIAYDVGAVMVRNGAVLNEAIFIKGLRDAINAKGHPDGAILTESERKEVKREVSKRRRELEKVERLATFEANQKAEKKFLFKNKKKRGVKTTSSGLQYKVLKKGHGPRPSVDQRVKVHYVGTLIDGTEFDSSFKRNRPAQFTVNRVVKGWTEALQMMRVGSKWKVFIPSALGYGEKGAGATIPPNSVLIFELELLEIVED